MNIYFWIIVQYYNANVMILSVVQELGSLLSMHGFQSLEDFGGLKESHLNELNITDAEQRTKILTATELLRDCRSTLNSI